jgi:hypothetical protein
MSTARKSGSASHSLECRIGRILHRPCRASRFSVSFDADILSCPAAATAYTPVE